MQISSVANLMVRMMNDFEVNAVSIERAKEYTTIPQEVPLINYIFIFLIKFCYACSILEMN